MIPVAQDQYAWDKDSFVVDFENGDPTTLGIEFSIIEGNDLVVLGVVPEKLADIYNRSASDDLQIMPGDRVSAVNGSSASAAALLTRLSETDSATVTFQHAILSRIEVEKRGKKLGLIVNHDKKPWIRFLQVEQVNDGVIMEYNKSSGSRGLQTGDRIVEVNGRRGRPDVLLRELGTKDMLHLAYLPAPGLMGG